MTVSDSEGRRFTVAQILRRSAQLGGILGAQQQLSTADRELGRFQLETVLDEIASEGGPVARALSFYELSLTSADVTAETYKFSLPANVLDVAGHAMWIPSDQADTERATGETAVRKVGWEQWHRMTDKGATASRPNLLYAHREADIVEAWLWPIPTDAGTLRIPVHRYLADVDDDTATLDLEPYWRSYLMRAMGEWWAYSKSLPVDEKAVRGARAQRAMKRARSQASEGVDSQIMLMRPRR